MAPPEGLEGELSLYLGRYLHLAVKLQLDAPVVEEEAVEQQDDRYGDYYSSYSDEPAITYPTRYRIEEDRIFRNGELRYFDHPKFGVLAKITRVEAEEETDDQIIGDDPVFDEIELLGE